LLAENVNLYGGFPDSGNPGLGDRNWETNPTILSGDLGVLGDTSDNSHTVLRISSLQNDSENTIDGFTITQGVADYDGGGVKISGSSSRLNTINIKDCIFLDNYADSEGAAIDVNSVTLFVSNCVFEDNYSGYEGAGISTSDTELHVTDCVFDSNYADYEGAAISHFSGHFQESGSILQCINTIFRGNQSGYEGAVVDARGDITLFNCLFDGNSAERSGGVLDLFQWGVVTATNCTFVNNVAGTNGSILTISSNIDTNEVSAYFRNCIFFENEGNGMIDKGNFVDEIVFSNCLLPGCPPGVSCNDTNITNTNPEFAGDEDYHLNSSSPCIDAGEADYFPINITLDLAGNERVAGTGIDMGAYEYSKPSSTESLDQSKIIISPNPASDYILLTNTGISIYRADLFSANGQMVSQWKLIPFETHTLSVNGLTPGMYFFKIYGTSGVISKKVVVR